MGKLRIIILGIFTISLLLNCKREKPAEEVSKSDPGNIPLKVMVTNAGGLTIRSESKMEAEVLGQVDKGKELIISKQVGEPFIVDDKNSIWVEVAYGDKVGYTTLEDYDYTNNTVQVEKEPFLLDEQTFCLELDPKDYPKSIESACFGDFNSCSSAQREKAGLVLKADGSFEISLSNSGERFSSVANGKWKKGKSSVELNGTLTESFPGNEIKYKVTGSLEFDKTGKIGLSKYQEKFISNTSPDCEGDPKECGAIDSKDIEKLRKKTPYEPQACLYPLDLNKKIWEKQERWSADLGKMNYSDAIKKCESMKMSLPSLAQWKQAENYNIPMDSEKDGYWAKSFAREEGKYSMVAFFASQSSYYLHDVKGLPTEEHLVRCIKD